METRARSPSPRSRAGYPKDHQFIRSTGFKLRAWTQLGKRIVCCSETSATSRNFGNVMFRNFSNVMFVSDHDVLSRMSSITSMLHTIITRTLGQYCHITRYSWIIEGNLHVRTYTHQCLFYCCI
jgi:hypothetical protein